MPAVVVENWTRGKSSKVNRIPEHSKDALPSCDAPPVDELSSPPADVLQLDARATVEILRPASGPAGTGQPERSPCLSDLEENGSIVPPTDEASRGPGSYVAPDAEFGTARVAIQQISTVTSPAQGRLRTTGANL